MAASISALSALESLPGTTTQLQSKPRRMRDRSDKARVYSEKQARRGARRHNRWLNCTFQYVVMCMYTPVVCMCGCMEPNINMKMATVFHDHLEGEKIADNHTEQSPMCTLASPCQHPFHVVFHNTLYTVLEIFELDEEPDWNYVETKNLTSFDKLLENASLTEQWINSAPAEFASVEDNFCCRPSYSEVKISFRQAEILTPSQRFNRMDRHIRKAYSRSNVPLEIIDTFEKELFCNFSSDPDMVLVWKIDNSFIRLLIHGLCQYHNLSSETSEMKNGAHHVIIENPYQHFVSSHSLCEFLQ